MISTKSRVAPPDAATSCRARTLSRRWKGCAKAEIRRGSRRAARATDGSGWPAERPTAHHRIRRAALRGRRRRSSAEPHSSLGRPQPGQNRNALVSVLPQRRQGRRFTDSLYAPPAHVPPSAPQRVTTRRGAALGRGGPFLSTPCRTRRDRGLSAEAPAACRLPPAGRTRTTFSPVSTDAESLAGLSALSPFHQKATSSGRRLRERALGQAVPGGRGLEEPAGWRSLLSVQARRCWQQA